MSLWNLPSDKTAVVVGIEPSLKSTFRERLVHLGFGVGETITCIRQTPFNGPRVYQVGDSVFSLAQDIATAVVIEEQEA